MGTDSISGAGQHPDGGALPRVLTGRTGFLLSMIGRFSRDATERALEPLAIKPHHYGILAVLDAMGLAPQHAVGERLGTDKSSMTVFADYLEALGLIERRRNPRNRRAYELKLTEAGREVLARAGPLVDGVEQAMMSGLDAEQRTQLHALLLRLLARLETNART